MARQGWALAVLCVCCACAVTFSGALTSKDWADVDSVVSAALSCHQAPGLSIAVVKDGKVAVSKGYGVMDLEDRRPVTSSTLFGIASLTKAFTSTLLVKLLDTRPHLQVTSRVSEVLGSDPFNNSLLSQYATLEDLMAHRTGVPSNDYIRFDTKLSRADLIRRVKLMQQAGTFRSSFYYSDIMYGVLARITELLGNGTWEDLMQQHIFQPLGMTSSTFATKLGSSPPVTMATPYVAVNGSLVKASVDFFKQWSVIGGFGSTLTSADDMAKWMLFHLSGGKNQNGTAVMDTRLLQETYRPRAALPPGSTYSQYFSRPAVPVTLSNDAYGLGWGTGYYRGLRILQHSGDAWGYHALITLFPDNDLGIFLGMSGKDSPRLLRASLFEYLADVMLGETPWLNASTVCSFPAPWHRQSTRRHAHLPRQSSHGHAHLQRQSSHGHARLQRQALEMHTPVHGFTRRASGRNLHRYVGRYHNDLYGDIEVTLNPHTHDLQAVYGVAQWDLHALTSADLFHAVWLPEPPRFDFDFRFVVGSGSDVTALKIRDFNWSYPPVFYKEKIAGNTPVG